MKKLVFVILVIGQVLYANALKEISDIEKLTKMSMAYIGQDKIEKGLEVLAPHSVVPARQFEALKKQLITEFPKFRTHFGAVIGSEYIGQVQVGKSLCQITYIQKFEKHILSWRFDYYKPKDKWVLNSFETADSMEVLFQLFGEKR